MTKMKDREASLVELLTSYDKSGKMSTELWDALVEWASALMRNHYKTPTRDSEAVYERVITFVEYFRQERSKSVLNARKRRAKAKRKQFTVPDILTIVRRWRYLVPRIEVYFQLKARGIALEANKGQSLYEFFKSQELLDFTELLVIEKAYDPRTYTQWLYAFLAHREAKKNRYIGRMAQASFLKRVYQYISTTENLNAIEHRHLSH